MPVVTLPAEYGVDGRLAVGLDWLDSDGSKRISKWLPGRKANYYVENSIDLKSTQYGLTDDSRLKGLPSLAALLASRHSEGDFYAVLPIDHHSSDEQLFWLVGIQDGQVIPGTDILGTESQITTELNTLTAMIDEGTSIFAPGYEEIFEADYTEPDFFFSGVLDYKSALVKKFFGFTILIAAVAILAVLFGGHYAYEAYEAKKLRDAIEAAKIREAARNAEDNIKTMRENLRQLEIDHLKETMRYFNTAMVIDESVAMLRTNPVYLAGWSFSEIKMYVNKSAKNGYIELHAIREHGYVSGLKEASHFGDYTIRFEPNGDKGYVRNPLAFDPTPIDSLPSDEILFPGKYKSDYDLTDYAQRARVEVNFSKPRPLPLPAEAAKLAKQLKVTKSVANLTSTKISISGDNLATLESMRNYFADNRYMFKLQDGDIKFTYPHSWKLQVLKYDIQ